MGGKRDNRRAGTSCNVVFQAMISPECYRFGYLCCVSMLAQLLQHRRKRDLRFTMICPGVFRAAESEASYVCQHVCVCIYTHIHVDVYIYIYIATLYYIILYYNIL